VWSIFCNIFVGTRFGNALQLLLFWAHMLLVIAAACSNSSGIISLCVGIYFINDPLYEFVQLLRGWLERPQKVRVVFACRRLAFRRVRWSRNSLFRATESLSPLLLSKKYSDHKESGSLESHLQFCSCMQTWSTGLVLLSAVYLFLCTIQGSTLHFLLSEISKLVFGLKVCYFVQRLGFQKSPSRSTFNSCGTQFNCWWLSELSNTVVIIRYDLFVPATLTMLSLLDTHEITRGRKLTVVVALFCSGRPRGCCHIQDISIITLICAGTDDFKFVRHCGFSVRTTAHIAL